MITDLRSLRGLQADLPLACLTGWHRIPDQLHLHHCFLGSIAEAVYLECSILHEIKTEKNGVQDLFFVDVYLKQCAAVIQYLKTSGGFLPSFAALVQVVTCSCKPGWGPADLLFLDESFVTSIGSELFCLRIQR